MILESRAREVLKSKIHEEPKLVREIASKLGVDLSPGKVSIEGNAYKKPYSVGGYTHYTVALYREDGSEINLVDLFEETFGHAYWAGKEFRVTIEELD